MPKKFTSPADYLAGTSPRGILGDELSERAPVDNVVIEPVPTPLPAPTPPPPPPPLPHLRLRAHVEIIAGGQIIYDAPWDMLVPMGAQPELLGVSGQSLDRFLEDASRHAIVAFNRYTEANNPKKNARRESSADRQVQLAISSETNEDGTSIIEEEILNTPPASLSDIISMQSEEESPQDNTST